jgi:hypothetical protein
MKLVDLVALWLEAFAPQGLQLAATCNTGSHASIGCGWFDLVTTP